MSMDYVTYGSLRGLTSAAGVVAVCCVAPLTLLPVKNTIELQPFTPNIELQAFYSQLDVSRVLWLWPHMQLRLRTRQFIPSELKSTFKMTCKEVDLMLTDRTLILLLTSTLYGN